MAGALNKTSYMLSYFHQKAGEEWHVCYIPFALSLLGQAETETFLEATLLPGISGWLGWTVFAFADSYIRLF